MSCDLNSSPGVPPHGPTHQNAKHHHLSSEEKQLRNVALKKERWKSMILPAPATHLVARGQDHLLGWHRNRFHDNEVNDTPLSPPPKLRQWGELPHLNDGNEDHLIINKYYTAISTIRLLMMAGNYTKAGGYRPATSIYQKHELQHHAALPQDRACTGCSPSFSMELRYSFKCIGNFLLVHPFSERSEFVQSVHVLDGLFV